MKNYWKIPVLISLILVFSVGITSIIIFFSFNDLVKDNTKKIAELSTTNIFSDINFELTKPIYVSKTMASDSFIKEWLANESPANHSQIIEYLMGIQQEYGYLSTFLISTESLHYYHYTGLHKTITPDDAHDVWYYDFVASGLDYEADVDIDEASGMLTLFINARMEDASDNLIAVVGVGVEMGYIQDFLSRFEVFYELEAFLINAEGLVQSHSNTNQILSRNIFNEVPYGFYESLILTNRTGVQVIEDHQSTDQYIITRYVPVLNWFIVVRKQINAFENFFEDYFWISLVNLFVMVGVVSMSVIGLIQSHQRTMIELALTDSLTGLYNRRGFNHASSRLLRDKSKEFHAIIFDIDAFKEINDVYGHNFGDQILVMVAKHLKQRKNASFLVCRYGGDEFAGLFQGTKDDLRGIIESIRSDIRNETFTEGRAISMSVGVASMQGITDSLEAMLKRADVSMYKSKLQGGDFVFEE